MELDFFKKMYMKLGTVQHIKGMIEELEEELLQFNENLTREYASPAQPKGFSFLRKIPNQSVSKRLGYSKNTLLNAYGLRKEATWISNQPCLS